MAYQKVEVEFNGQPLTIETGKMARQADGATVVTYGETKVLCTAVSARKMREGQGFLPPDRQLSGKILRRPGRSPAPSSAASAAPLSVKPSSAA